MLLRLPTRHNQFRPLQAPAKGPRVPLAEVGFHPIVSTRLPCGGWFCCETRLLELSNAAFYVVGKKWPSFNDVNL